MQNASGDNALVRATLLPEQRPARYTTPTPAMELRPQPRSQMERLCENSLEAHFNFAAQHGIEAACKDSEKIGQGLAFRKETLQELPQGTLTSLQCAQSAADPL